MFFFKSCTRCNGDMRLETDLLGRGFVHCLSCGFSIELPKRRSRARVFADVVGEIDDRKAS